MTHSEVSMEAQCSMILRQWYSNHVYSPPILVLELDKYLPKCYQFNRRIQMVSISIHEYLSELPDLIRFDGIAKDTLEERIDELAEDVYSQFPDYRDQTDIIRLVEDTTMLMMNVGDELYHKLHSFGLYQQGGFHHYRFKQAFAPDSVCLAKIPWTELVSLVTNPSVPHHNG